MKIRALILSSIGAVGLYSSCISNQAVLNKTTQQQYATMAKNEEIIDKYGYSTLKPNGKLSSIEGKDILYFSTQNDSIAYEKAHRLSNGLVRKAQVENQNSTEQLLNNYLRTKAATDGYYKAMLNNNSNNNHFIDLHIDYKNALENLEQNNTILSKEAHDSYKKQIKNAYKEGKQIRKYARKAFVIAQKMP